MKSVFDVALLVVTALTAGSATAAKFPYPKLVPMPREMTYEGGRLVALDSNTVLTVRCPESAAAGWAARHFADWFGVGPKVAGGSEATVSGEEAYALAADASGVRIEARTLAGVRYAMYTLRQLAMAERGVAVTRRYVLPSVRISDAPSLDWRGMHFCWFPELGVPFVEHAIRMAAYLKFRYVVLESWGVFRSERHPWYGWPDGPMTKAELKRLRGIADDLGVTLVPQLNAYGHASLSRGKLQKHAVLDLHPERQSLFEPVGGWNWCLTNPEAMRIQRELIAEMHEAFGNPPYFHIGCDEAYPPSCPDCCSTNYQDLVFGHIRGLRDFLKARGARALMWHDMLCPEDDEEGKDLLPGKGGLYGAHGAPGCERYARQLPKDILVCDWYYGEHIDGWRYTSHEYFQKLGFEVLTCPWHEVSGILAQGKAAKELGWRGMLGTTWHHLTGPDFARALAAASSASWGTDPGVDLKAAEPAEFGTFWRQVGWDMGLRDRRETGLAESQVSLGATSRVD